MRNPHPKRSFNVVSKYGFLLLLTALSTIVKAQQKKVDGVTFDKNSKERIAKVNVLNLRTKESIYNNLQAEFHIGAQPGDKLVFSKQYYFSDTITVKDYSSLAVYLKPTAIMLQQVNVKDTAMTPQKKLEATKRDYNRIYGSLGNRDILSVSPYGGAGLSIDAIYNSLSRSGRNAEHLKEIIERDYHENIIDYRYNKTLVGSVTGLQDPQLSDFMRKYRPSYYMVATLSDYDFIAIIRSNYRRYLRNPRAFTIPPLKLNE